MTQMKFENDLKLSIEDHLNRGNCSFDIWLKSKRKHA